MRLTSIQQKTKVMKCSMIQIFSGKINIMGIPLGN